MTRPLISVIIPVYNGEQNITRCVESLFAQTVSDFELLFIENGSTDRSRELLFEYAAQYPCCSVLVQDHADLVDALNLGLSAATGRYIARMDIDDVCLPNRFECQIRFFEENPRAGVVGSRVLVTSGEETTVSAHLLSHEELMFNRKMPFPAGLFAHPSVMFLPERISTPIRYRKRFRFAEDYDLWLRLGNVCEMGNVATPLLQYIPSPSLRTKRPYIAFKSCVAAWIDANTSIDLEKRDFWNIGKNISLIRIFEELKEEEAFRCSVALLGFGCSMGLSTRMLRQCILLVSRCFGDQVATDAIAFLRYILRFSPATEALHCVCAEWNRIAKPSNVADAARWVADWLGWVEPPSLESGASIDELFSMPSPDIATAEQEGVFLFVECLYRARDQTPSEYDWATRQGRLAFMGYCHLWLFPRFGFWTPPIWHQEVMSAPSTSFPEAKSDGLSLLLESLWLADPWLQSFTPLSTSKGRLRLLQWFVDAKFPGTYGGELPFWQAEAVRCMLA